jgi:hypothetical protein
VRSDGFECNFPVLCWGASSRQFALLFWYINDPNSLFWFMRVYGYFVIGGFGTFTVYLPELFPTRVRATGQGFWLAMTLAHIDFDAFSLLQLPNLDRYDFADT